MTMQTTQPISTNGLTHRLPRQDPIPIQIKLPYIPMATINELAMRKIPDELPPRRVPPTLIDDITPSATMPTIPLQLSNDPPAISTTPHAINPPRCRGACGSVP